MTKEDGKMTDWRAKIIELIEKIDSEKKLHHLYNFVVRLCCAGED